jgi:hypothetical protein
MIRVRAGISYALTSAMIGEQTCEGRRRARSPTMLKKVVGACAVA